MTLAVDWTNATLAGSFVAGLAFGVVVTLRIARVVIDLFATSTEKRKRRRRQVISRRRRPQ